MGTPSEADLRRAVGNAYYALFHSIARTVADCIVPSRSGDLCEAAWTLAYRGLDHGALRNACKNARLTGMDTLAIAKFTDIVPKMQAKRHLADYDPRCALTATEVGDDIDQCEAAILAFDAAPEAERRAFVAFVLFKGR